MRRAVVVAVAVVGVIAAAGFWLQERRDAELAAENPPPGEFVDIGSHRLHYRLQGSGPVTFVLEAGAGEYSGSWGEFGDSLARIGRVFTYDRAGLGWSEPGPRPRTPARVAAELHRALETIAVPSPRILVGHSLGGAFATHYAIDHPNRTAGLLLIDPSHRDQFERLADPPAWKRWLASQLPRFASFGLSYVMFESRDPVKNRSSHLRTYGAELRAFMGFDRSGDGDAPAGHAGPIDLDSIPIVVLTAGDPGPEADESGGDGRSIRRKAWRGLHADLVEASASEFSRHVIVDGADHYIQRDRPAVVLDAAAALAAVVMDEAAEGDGAAPGAADGADS